MDAKPQRPRVNRVYDENNLPHQLAANPLGKTLAHQRHKSSPALSVLLKTNPSKAAAAAAMGAKKALGEANANKKMERHIAKDDSDVGKQSPGKLLLHQHAKTEIIAPLARPATRPLTAKSILGQSQLAVALTGPTNDSHERAGLAQSEIARKVVPKKSVKALKDAVTAPVVAPQRVEADLNRAVPETSLPTSITTAPEPAQQVRSTVPIITNSVAIANHRADQVPVNSSQAYLQEPFAQVQLSQPQPSTGVPIAPLPTTTPQTVPSDHLYAVEEEEYYVDDDYTTARSLILQAESTGTFTTILPPVHTGIEDKELAAAKQFVELTRTPEDVEDEQWDTSMVAEYGEEIFSYMRDLEKRMAPNPHYMDQQQEIQWSMRAVLMDWVVQVHQRFNLLPETLFLTVNYIDRFLSCKVVSLGKLQLVGATAIFVAAKYEEVQCPTISEIIYMVDGGYSVDELLKAERFMLSMLMFELGWPGPMSFLRRISKADDYDLETRTLAKYFLEVTIMDERFVGSTPSYLAAGAHCMARLMLAKGDWSLAHVHYSGYTYSQLMPLLNGMLECCEDPQRHHAAVYEKYTDRRYKRASTFVANTMRTGFQLPAISPRVSAKSIDPSFALW